MGPNLADIVSVRESHAKLHQYQIIRHLRVLAVAGRVSVFQPANKITDRYCEHVYEH